MDIKKLLPNILTLANLIVGFSAILLISETNYRMAVGFVIVRMILDGLDGKVARKLQVSGDFGTELDSLCDVVSFGVVPSYFMWSLLVDGSGGFTSILLTVLAFLFLICGAYRLARFNVETTSGDDFTGIPITIAGGILALSAFYAVNVSVVLILILALVLSLLMISEVPYPAFKNLQLPDQPLWYVVFIAVVLLFTVFPFLFLGLLIIYLVSGSIKLVT